MLNREALEVLVHRLTRSSTTTVAAMRCGSARRFR
jgi:hypothetical protein